MGAAYPTPPPPGISPSSSSLAHALGTPPSHGHSRPVSLPQKMYQSQESRAFYEDFLDRKLKQMNQQAPPSLSPPKSRNSASYSFESTSNSVSYIPNPLPNAVNSPPSTYHHFNATQNSTPTYSLGGALVPHSVALPSPQTHVNSRNPSPYQTPVCHVFFEKKKNSFLSIFLLRFYTLLCILPSLQLLNQPSKKYLPILLHLYPRRKLLTTVQILCLYNREVL